MSDLNQIVNPFEFTGAEIRTAVDEQDAVWFCAKDVFEALDITWSQKAGSLKNYPENWVRPLYLQGQSGFGEVIYISEPAVYKAIFSSRKPEAEKFANWVFEEVLPALRKNGFFGQLNVRDQIQVSKQIGSLTEQIIATKDAFRRKLLGDQLHTLCNMVNQPMPPLEWLGKDYNQLPLLAGGSDGRS